MNAVGNMDTLINLETFIQVKDTATGQLTKTHSTFLVTWAQVMEKAVSEVEKTQQITSLDEKIFRIRYEALITQKMRIYVPGTDRYYDITGIAMEGRKRYLLLSGRSTNVNAVA